MSRKSYLPNYYEKKLNTKYPHSYSITPTESWRGLRTNVTILCHHHKTSRSVWLQKVFNGKNSTWPCRQCYLDSISTTEVKEGVNTCGNNCTSCKCAATKVNLGIDPSPTEHPPTASGSPTAVPIILSTFVDDVSFII